MGMKRFIALIISVANYAREVLGRFSTITSSVSSVQSVVAYTYLPSAEWGWVLKYKIARGSVPRRVRDAVRP